MGRSCAAAHASHSSAVRLGKRGRVVLRERFEAQLARESFREMRFQRGDRNQILGRLVDLVARPASA